MKCRNFLVVLTAAELYAEDEMEGNTCIESDSRDSDADSSQLEIEEAEDVGVEDQL